MPMSHKESLTEIMDRNKRILLAEYQKGFLAGFKDAEKKLIEEFLEDINKFPYSIDTETYLTKIVKKWEERLK